MIMNNLKLISLSPDGQNILIEKIINDFCPRFTSNSHIIYVGDTDEKFAYFDESALWELGIKIDSHGKCQI
jgi:adenine-specific DNA-methyltransferase